MESNNQSNEVKPDIIAMFTKEGKFDIGAALRYLDNINKYQEERIAGLEEAMQFFSEWYNKTQRANILLPDNLEDDGSKTIIL